MYCVVERVESKFKMCVSCHFKTGLGHQQQHVLELHKRRGDILAFDPQELRRTSPVMRTQGFFILKKITSNFKLSQDLEIMMLDKMSLTDDISASQSCNVAEKTDTIVFLSIDTKFSWLFYSLKGIFFKIKKKTFSVNIKWYQVVNSCCR